MKNMYIYERMSVCDVAHGVQSQLDTAFDRDVEQSCFRRADQETAPMDLHDEVLHRVS